jgi:hypothetical protein
MMPDITEEGCIMKELEDSVIAAFRGIVSSGKLNHIIEEKVGETVKGVIDSALRSYSDFGKALSKAVEESLSIDKDRLALPGYNEIVLQIVKNKLEHGIQQIGKERLEKDMENLLSGGIPKEVPVSKLVDEFKAWVREESYRNDHDDRITYIAEKSEYGGGWIYLDAKQDRKKYDCRFRLAYSSEGEIYSTTISGKDADKNLFLGGLSGFERTLFRCYAAKTRIVLDTDEPDIYQPEGE